MQVMHFLLYYGFLFVPISFFSTLLLLKYGEQNSVVLASSMISSLSEDETCHLPFFNFTNLFKFKNSIRDFLFFCKTPEHVSSLIHCKVHMMLKLATLFNISFVVTPCIILSFVASKELKGTIPTKIFKLHCVTCHHYLLLLVPQSYMSSLEL